MKQFCVPAVALGLSALVGCSTRTFSHTPRTALEQLLLSSAVDLALAKFEMPELNGRKVHADLTNLKSYDVEYVRVAVRARIAAQGAVLVEAADRADMVVEVASGALAMEHKTGTIGIPQLPVPQSDVPLPEVPFHKKVEQTAIMKLLIFVHRKGKFVAAGWYYAKSDRDESFILGWRIQRKDDVRQGWERADAKLGSKSPGDSAPK